jgi:hypothetical protein
MIDKNREMEKSRESWYNIGSSAKSDVIRHAKTQNHLKLVSFQNQSKPISSFLPGANSTLNDKAETLFSNFVAEHHV